MFADMLCNERLHYIILTTKTLLIHLAPQPSPPNLIIGGSNVSVFHPFPFYVELTCTLSLTKNAAKFYSSHHKKLFWRKINNLMSCKYVAYSDIAEHISSFSG